MLSCSITPTKLIDHYLAKIIIGITLLFISAQIEIPIRPVPITLQSMAVIFIGLCFKPKEALMTVLTYLTFGFLGLPIFSSLGSGISALLSPSSGYLLGFAPGAFITSLLIKKFKIENWLPLLVASFIGTIIIFSCGIMRLNFLMNFESAIKYGLIPFIMPGILKSIILVSGLKLYRCSNASN